MVRLQQRLAILNLGQATKESLAAIGSQSVCMMLTQIMVVRNTSLLLQFTPTPVVVNRHLKGTAPTQPTVVHHSHLLPQALPPMFSKCQPVYITPIQLLMAHHLHPLVQSTPPLVVNRTRMGIRRMEATTGLP